MRLHYIQVVGTLGTGGLDATATSHTFAAALTYAAGATVPTLNAGDHFMLTILDSGGNVSEVVQVTAYDSTTKVATLVRAQEDTTGVVHAAGARVIQAFVPSDLALSDSDIAPVAPNEQTADFTFSAEDAARLTLANVATAITGTIPTNATVPFSPGTILPVMQTGVGPFQFVGAAGVTVHPPNGDTIASQFGQAYATMIGVDEWVIGGDVTS